MINITILTAYIISVSCKHASDSDHHGGQSFVKTLHQLRTGAISYGTTKKSELTVHQSSIKTFLIPV